MKKQFIILILAFSNLMFSQIKFGAKGGLNLTDASVGVNIKGTFMEENIVVNSGGSGQGTTSQTTRNFNETFYVATSTKFSYYIGAFAEYPINKKGNLALKTELLYCQNGTTVNKKTMPENEDIYYTTNGGSIAVGQINIPLMLKYSSPKKLAFLAGIYAGTTLFAKSTSSQGLTKTENFNAFDFGLNFGASYPINKNWALDVRYNHGLLNIDKARESDNFITIQSLYYNRSFYFGLEYLF